MRHPVTVQVAAEPVLRRYRAALEAIYGDRLARVVLFGSRARGDAHGGSDYDVAVFLNDVPNFWQEMLRLPDLRVDFLDATGEFFDSKPFPLAAWNERTPLMHEIRRDGVEL